MSFLTKYEALCDKKGVSPSVMPTLVGMSNAIYSKSWKYGAIPRKGNLKKIADFFEVDVSYFKDDNENDQKEKAPVPKDERQIKIETLMHLLSRMTPEQLDSFIVIAEGMVK